MPEPEHTLLLVGPAAMTAMYTRWSLPIHTIIPLVRAKHILKWGIKAKNNHTIDNVQQSHQTC